MNKVTLAVAGSRKTQSIVDHCSLEAGSSRRLLLTYTSAGQDELRTRLEKQCAITEQAQVMGWFTFLMRHCIKPYLPYLYPGRRLEGFLFDDEPRETNYAIGAARHFTPERQAYRRHLAHLAHEVIAKSNGSVIDRLEHLFTEIWIDEAQDLTGWDLEIMTILFKSKIDIFMVGDVRQSLISTNPRDAKNKQFRHLKMLDWFRREEAADRLTISYNQQTFRCNQAIADFSDSIFSNVDFGRTISANTEVTAHDGIFGVCERDVQEYMEAYSPQCLHYSKTSGRHLLLAYDTFGRVKGRTWERVLIFPTGSILKFLKNQAPLPETSACGLYVAVTRARFSVAFIVPDGTRLPLSMWSPDDRYSLDG